eukprot:364256-Chlamydomonas_euryale.AAC.3
MQHVHNWRLALCFLQRRQAVRAGSGVEGRTGGRQRRACVRKQRWPFMQRAVVPVVWLVTVKGGPTSGMTSRVSATVTHAAL